MEQEAVSHPVTLKRSRDQLDLQRIEIFAGAATVTLNRLAMACTRRHYPARQQILSRDSLLDDVLLLLEGEVKVTLSSSEGREVVIRRIHAGQVFGDYAAIDGQRRSADVVAVTDVVVGHIPAREFLHLITADPAVAVTQMRDLVAMVRQLSVRIYEMTTFKAGERLVAVLLRMADNSQGKTGQIDTLPTHAELAALISSQRHVVTSELARLEKQGLIARHGQGLRLLNPDALRRLQPDPALAGPTALS